MIFLRGIPILMIVGRVCLMGWECKWVFFLYLFIHISISIAGVNSTSRQLLEVRRRLDYYKKHAIKSIQSEDGDIIDCIDIYKQPAFDHPALRNHKIQMIPSYEQSVEIETITNKSTKQPKMIPTYQLWQKNGSCPIGTIPIRRIREKDLLNFNTIEDYGRKGPSFPPQPKKPDYNEDSNFLQVNRSYAILMTQGIYNYNGAKADIKVWTPHVENDDEYSTSRIALKNGPYNGYESVESGWVVNPTVYGDRETRIYTYWTVDGSNTTGCFDLLCPGFVQTTNEIALGGVIRSIPVPGGLPWIMTLYIVKDIKTKNWWVQYQDNINIGYWPAEIFDSLSLTAETVQWGGEVYSSRLGHPGHTNTAMGSGQFPDFVFQDSGWTKRMRVRDNSMVLKYPEYAYAYTDDYRCYDVYLYWEYIADPEFYFGGPGRSYLCP